MFGRPSVVLSFACLLTLSISAQATTVERLTLEELAVRAPLIVEGTVRSSESHWSSNGKLIITTTTIEVTDSIKGQAPRTVAVTTIGGQVGRSVLRVAGMPVFKPGEATVVFLEPSGAYRTVLGLGQGKFTIRAGEVSNSVSDLSFPDGGHPRSLKMQLATFKSEVRSLANRKK
jgi:hypothetical protein